MFVREFLARKKIKSRDCITRFLLAIVNGNHVIDSVQNVGLADLGLFQNYAQRHPKKDSSWKSTRLKKEQAVTLYVMVFKLNIYVLEF